MIRTLGRIAATLALVACGTSLPTWNGSRTEKEKLVRTTLANGLKVVLLQDHAAPVVALNIWVRVGSADESDAEAGMAHVFEHMLFKGTERREVGEIARTVEAAGGNINAFTSFDMTVYFITMASRDAAVGIDVLSDAVLHSAFDETELAKEQKVVLEEIRRGEDSPGRVLSQAIFASAYQTHPYRLPVIGTPESVTSFTRDQMVDFHRRWYVPNNMTFVVVGDFDPDAVLAQIEKAFAEAPARPDLAHSRSPETPQTEPRGGIVRRDFEQTQVGIAFPITSFREPDVAYLDLLSAILGGGESSRLYRNVKDRRQLVHTIGAGAYTPADAGLFFVDATLDPEQLEEALAAIAEEIHRLQILGPSEIELDRARTNLLSHEVHEKETMQGQARKLGFWESLARGLEEEKAYLDRIRRATAADVRRVAGQYLVADHATLMALLSNDRRPELQGDDLVAAYRAGDRAASALEAEDLGAGILRYTLSNGLRVIVKRNPSVPLVSMRLSFLGGQLVEDEASQGISSFVAAMLDRGTEHRSASQIAAEVENIAGGLDGFSGRNSFGLTGEFLRDSLDTGLELFVDVLLFPTFPVDEIEKLRTEQLAAIQRREDNLAAKAFELFGTGLFERHPYRFPSLGTEASVKGFGQGALRQYWDAWAVPSNGVLAIVGDVDPNEIVEAVSVYLGDWGGHAPAELPSRSLPDAPTNPRELVLEKGKQQIHIVVGFLGISVSDPDGPALDVLSQVLSGQGGRLFLELRDQQSLAYTVTAFAIEGVDPGSFAVYIASAPDKRDAALEGLKRELQRIVDEPVSDDELERAKGYLIGSQAVSLQRYGTQASLLSLDELYGLGAPHHLEFRERIEAVTAADVQRVAQRLIRTDAPVIAVVE
jgi:zinc protease